MNLSASRNLIRNPLEAVARTRVNSAVIYNVIIVFALFAFEGFNYGTTAYALRDLLGDLRFAGISWATLMALAFCGLDFAGIARLITQKGRSENARESWYLFSAWLIAAAFNATLTWWGVSMVIANHTLRSAAVVSTRTLTSIVPVLVAIMVWVIRILIIGTLTSALDKGRQGQKSAEKSRNNTPAPTGFPVQPTPTTAFTAPHNNSIPARPLAAQASHPTGFLNRTPQRPASRPANDFMAAENYTRK